MPIQKTSREEILIKAMQVFRQKGYHNTSISDLALACGIEKPHFYYYFKKGKEELMLSVLEMVLTYFTEKIHQHAYEKSIPAEDRLSYILGKFERIYMRAEGGCIMGNTTLEIAGLDKHQSFLPTIRKFFDEMILALTHIYASKHDEILANEKAVAAVQDIQGGILLMQLYKDPSYVQNSFARVMTHLS